eukprot:m.211291 g.211291  ORF g.211291 m.211291 type:complete len:737 (+) comp17148_c0_seq13:406-2616(+)
MQSGLDVAAKNWMSVLEFSHFTKMALLFLLATLLASSVAWDNGLARQPPMGFNTWNHWHSKVSSKVLLEVATTFKQLGLDKSGYRYINTDDGWLNKARDSNGRQVPGSNFPEGILRVSQSLAELGFNFGIYSAAAFTTCLGRAGSLYHETIDAQTYAEWNVSYLKYDACGEKNLNSYAKYSIMRDAINATGHSMVFSYEPHVPVTIAWPQYVGNSWRTGKDIGSSFSALLREMESVNQWGYATGPGAWGDADMLEVGNNGLSLAEQRSHFALWAAVKSPLLIGANITEQSTEALAILNNTEIIAVNQDALGIQAVKVFAYGHADDVTERDHPLRWAAKANQKHLDNQRTSTSPVPLDANMPFTSCQYTSIDSTQKWTLDRTRLRNGQQCLARVQGDVVVTSDCSDQSSEWLMEGVTQHATQIRVIDSSETCLALNTTGTYLQPCKQEPTKCNTSKCDNSVLVDQLFYLSKMTGQLISTFTNVSVVSPRYTKGSSKSLLVAPCNASDEYQQWGWMGHTLANKGDGRCLTQGLGFEDCSSSSTNWTLASAPGYQLKPEAASDMCVDIYNFTGPGVQLFKCKAPNSGYRGSQNEQFVYDNSTGLMRTNEDESCCGIRSPLCLAQLPTPVPQMVNIPQCLATQPSPAPAQPKIPDLIDSSLPLQVYKGPLANDNFVVIYFNTGSHTTNMSATWSQLGLKADQGYLVRDLYLKQDLGVYSSSLSLSVGSHDVRALRLSPSN